MLKFCVLAAIVALAASATVDIPEPTGDDSDTTTVTVPPLPPPPPPPTMPVPPPPTVPVPDPRIYLINTNQQLFSLKMLDALCTQYPDESVFFSPHSTYRTLLLAYLGAEGDTETSLKQGLQLDWATSKEEVLAAYKTGLDAIETRSLGDNVKLNTVDKVFVTKDAKLKSHIIKVLTNKQIERVNFARPDAVRARINAQVENITQQHIKDFLPPGSVTSNSNVVLANAAFFKGTWKNQFTKESTKNETFHVVGGATNIEVEMMYVNGAKFSHGTLTDEGAEFCELPYMSADSSILMTVFIPTSGTVKDLVGKLTPETFKKTQQEGTLENVAVKFPKLSLEKEYPLEPVLNGRMGMDKLFGSNGNFNGFADNVAVSFDDILHKVVLNVDEEGTTAAAATATTSRGGGEVFFANRPFVYTITDKVSNEILFAGVYYGPPAATSTP